MPAAVGLSSVESIIAVGRHVAEAVGRRRELPSASAGGGCTHTHTHTHTLSELWGPALEKDVSIGGGEGGGSNAVSGKSLGGCSRTSPI